AGIEKLQRVYDLLSDIRRNGVHAGFQEYRVARVAHAGRRRRTHLQGQRLRLPVADPQGWNRERSGMSRPQRNAELRAALRDAIDDLDFARTRRAQHVEVLL